MANDVAHFPFAASRLDVPVSRIINDVVEFSALGAHYVEYGSFATVIHWVDWHGSLLLMFKTSSFQQYRMFLNTSHSTIIIQYMQQASPERHYYLLSPN